jgi:hypothetical protein
MMADNPAVSSSSSSLPVQNTHLNEPDVLDYVSTSISNPTRSEKIGYVLYVERLLGSDTIVWAEDRFFRLSDTPKNFKPLTPIAFSTSYAEGHPVGRYSAPSYEGFFSKVLFDDITPFVKGTFVRKGTDKVTFSFNPNGLLTNPSLSTFFTHSFAGLVYDCEVLAQFSIRPPRFSSEVAYPFIKCIKSQVGLSVPLVEPKSNILPLSFIRDLAENPAFNFLLGIGIPENPYLPTLSFQEFCDFRDNGPLIWKRLSGIMAEKYKHLAAADNNKGSINSRFHNRLLIHSNNESKGILVFPGCWSNFSAVSFSQSLIPTTKLSVYSLSFAHPFTNIHNVCEVNPMISGGIGDSIYSDRHFFPTPICLGEEGIDGEIHYGYEHNRHFLILSKVKLTGKSARDNVSMFHPFTHTQLKYYESPDIKDTGSEIDDSFVLASFLKGSKAIDAISQCGLFHRKVADLPNAWSNFDVFQLYSRHEPISKAALDKFLSLSCHDPTFLGKGICDSALAYSPCSPNNRYRIIKLGSIKSISSPRLRSLPIAILQRLGLVDQVLPLANFYFKVRLCEDVLDSTLHSQLFAFNKNIKDNLFNSCTDGQDSFSLNPFSIKAKNPKKPLLVIDCPPFNMKEEMVVSWLARNFSASDISIRWADGPRGTALIVDCSLPIPHPSEFIFENKHYKINYFLALPAEYKFIDSPCLPVESSLFNYFNLSQTGSIFPEHLEEAVVSLLSDSSSHSSSSSSSIASTGLVTNPTVTVTSTMPNNNVSSPTISPSNPTTIFPTTSTTSLIATIPANNNTLPTTTTSISSSSSTRDSNLGRRAKKDLLPHQIPVDDDDSSSDYNPNDETKEWTRPSKRNKEINSKRRAVASLSSNIPFPLSSSISPPPSSSNAEG